jgi:hypothetical protein
MVSEVGFSAEAGELQAASASVATDNSIFKDTICFPLLLILFSRCKR